MDINSLKGGDFNVNSSRDVAASLLDTSSNTSQIDTSFKPENSINNMNDVATQLHQTYGNKMTQVNTLV